jgi:hypothetical protein
MASHLEASPGRVPWGETHLVNQTKDARTNEKSERSRQCYQIIASPVKGALSSDLVWSCVWRVGRVWRVWRVAMSGA